MTWTRWDDERHSHGQRRAPSPLGNQSGIYRRDLRRQSDGYIRALAETGGYRDALEGSSPHQCKPNGANCPLRNVNRVDEGRKSETGPYESPDPMGYDPVSWYWRDRGSANTGRRRHAAPTPWWVRWAPLAFYFSLGCLIGVVVWRLWCTATRFDQNLILAPTLNSSMPSSHSMS